MTMLELPDCWKLVEAVLNKIRTLYLWGPPGTGKSHAAQILCNRPDVITTTLTDDTPAAEMRGYDIPVNGTYEWRDGPFIRAWKHGALLVVNELPRASMDMLSFALAILDNPEVAQYTLPTGQTVKPLPTFACIATGNEPPDSLTEALRDRFPVSIHIDAVHPGALLRLPEKLRHPASQTVLEEDPNRRIGLRAWYAFAGLSETVNPDMAAKACFGIRATEILDAIKVSQGVAQVNPVLEVPGMGVLEIK